MPPIKEGVLFAVERIADGSKMPAVWTTYLKTYATHAEAEKAKLRMLKKEPLEYFRVSQFIRRGTPHS